MNRHLIFVITICCFLCLFAVRGQKQVDVLVVGGGAGGTSAAIQAARMGTSVLILEKTPWLGGMLTAAGVSAIDGNHQLPSGIWGEFRDSLYAHYGGPKEIATGWVSHTLFEPSVGNSILKNMVNIPNLNVAYSAVYKSIDRVDGFWKVRWEQGGKENFTKAKILIDATETGELLPIVGANFHLGMDSKSQTGEAKAPDIPNTIVQDMTYVAILEDVGNTKGKKGLVKKPKGYDAAKFECACKRPEGEMFGGVSDCQQMLNYGKLPNKKYMINWPNCGNDYYLDWPNLSEEEKMAGWEKAKQHTLEFVYYIQNDLGFKNLRIVDEFPTSDNLPFVPYDREGRRVKGKVFLTVDHLEKPYNYELYRTGVAVGDYPIDHHHDKNPGAPEIDFINIRVPSYNIPLGCLIPENIDAFLVAEKNISVSNIVNGTTRLQPVVLGIGQASGALAATAILEDKSPAEVSIRKVQNALLEDKVYLMPFIDTRPDDPAFDSMQRIGACGILRGYGVPFKWANQTWFYPERIVSEFEWKQGLELYFPEIATIPASGRGLTLRFMLNVIEKLNPEFNVEAIKEKWNELGIDQPYDSQLALNRRTTSILTDHILRPFETGMDLEGKILKED